MEHTRVQVCFFYFNKVMQSAYNCSQSKLSLEFNSLSFSNISIQVRGYHMGHDLSPLCEMRTT